MGSEMSCCIFKPRLNSIYFTHQICDAHYDEMVLLISENRLLQVCGCPGLGVLSIVSRMGTDQGEGMLNHQIEFSVQGLLLIALAGEGDEIY